MIELPRTARSGIRRRASTNSRGGKACSSGSWAAWSPSPFMRGISLAGRAPSARKACERRCLSLHDTHNEQQQERHSRAPRARAVARQGVAAGPDLGSRRSGSGVRRGAGEAMPGRGGMGVEPGRADRTGVLGTKSRLRRGRRSTDAARRSRHRRAARRCGEAASGAGGASR